MKICCLSFIIYLFFSCASSSENLYIGTTGARYGISPFPDSRKWTKYITSLVKSSESRANDSILWVCGSFSKNGLRMNFPGKEREGISFDVIDYNAEYLEYFNKKKIDVFLMIEPDNLDFEYALKSVLDKYSGNKCVKGICIDLEWLDNKITYNKIESLFKTVKSYNSSNKLILKHWNINMVEPYLKTDVIYIQNMEGVSSIDELEKRYKLWERKFFPSPVGMEIGFKEDLYLYEYNNPIRDIVNLFNDERDNLSLFWCEETVIEYLKKLDMIKQ